MQNPSNTLTISVIIPVCNGGMNFHRCLSSVFKGETIPLETIVVLDGFSDESRCTAENFDTIILENPIQRGPARARNMGAKKAKGDILFFIDADVMIQKQTIGSIIDLFKKNPDLAAVFGSYDDEPFQKNFLSQYKNVFHHYVHQTSNEEASTFWGACGAMHRDIFLRMGGFNENYDVPSIEDIELGYRLKTAGFRIMLLKELQVKHLKHWGVFTLLKTDFFYRAIPWARLILKQRRFPDDLNLKISDRLSTMSVYLLIIFLLAGIFFSKWFFIPIALVISFLIILNRDFYLFFKHRRGFYFMLKAIPWHWFYFFYSGLAFALVFAEHQVKQVVRLISRSKEKKL